MMERSIGPCVFPGCKDLTGSPVLTRDVICESSRRHYLRVLGWLGWDYVTLWATMPSPVARGPKIRSSSGRSYGHPAEWASDQKADIAAKLHGWESALRDYLHHSPAVPETSAERVRVSSGLEYLALRFDDLCVFPGADDAAVELSELHTTIRGALGQFDRPVHLAAPCPACELLTLFRSTFAGGERITCRSCGVEVDADQYQSHIKTLANRALDTVGPVVIPLVAGATV